MRLPGAMPRWSGQGKGAMVTAMVKAHLQELIGTYAHWYALEVIDLLSPEGADPNVQQAKQDAQRELEDYIAQL